MLCLVGMSAGLVFGQEPIGDVYASDASVRGSVVLAGGGTRVLSGSTVAAGMAAATVKLARGGALRVCPGSNVELSTSKSGQALAIGFSTGAVELHYDVASNADTLQTSDFRLLLAGPGTFHLAISADAMGNTCVRPMAQNTSSVIVQELFGDGTYQVKPDESIVFRKGKVADFSRDVPPDCGCPAAPEVKRAEAPPQPAEPLPTEEARRVDPPRPDGIHHEHTPPIKVEVESPFVYHADSSIPDPPVIANLRMGDRVRLLQFQPVVLPPPTGTKVAAPKREIAQNGTEKGFFHRVRAFLAAVFK